MVAYGDATPKPPEAAVHHNHQEPRLLWQLKLHYCSSRLSHTPWPQSCSLLRLHLQMSQQQRQLGSTLLHQPLSTVSSSRNHSTIQRVIARQCGLRLELRPTLKNSPHQLLYQTAAGAGSPISRKDNFGCTWGQIPPAKQSRR